MADSATMNRGSRRPTGQICYGTAPCSLGFVMLAATDDGVCCIELGDGPDELSESLRSRFPCQPIAEQTAGELAEWLTVAVNLIDSPAAGSSMPLDERGTEFQRLVWATLRDIPAGETRTYAEVAEAIGRPSAVRAVATACASNPLAVLTPCHRVVRSDGTLSGYRWGVERKQTLLDREAVSSGGVR